MLGEKIQRLRKERGLSQEQLAERLTISRQAVSKWELGESMPDTENVLQLSKLFGVSTDFLLDDGYEEVVNAEKEPQKEKESIQKGKPSLRRTVGLILLCAGLAALILVAVFAAFADLWTALMISVPLILCGAVCLTVRRHTALWCCWAVYILFYGIFAFVSGNGFLWVLLGMGKRAFLMILPLAALLAVTGRLIYKNRKRKDR